MSDERKLTAEQVAAEEIRAAWWRIGRELHELKNPDGTRMTPFEAFRSVAIPVLESYAARRVAEELEACAQTCDKEHFPITHQTGVRSACGAAIRRRGQK